MAFGKHLRSRITPPSKAHSQAFPQLIRDLYKGFFMSQRLSKLGNSGCNASQLRTQPVFRGTRSCHIDGTLAI